MHYFKNTSSQPSLAIAFDSCSLQIIHVRTIYKFDVDEYTGVTAWRALLVRSWMLTTRRVDSATVVARDMAPATSRRPPCPALPGPAWLSIPTGQTDVARETHYRRRFVRSKLRSVIHRRRGAYR